MTTGGEKKTRDEIKKRNDLISMMNQHIEK